MFEPFDKAISLLKDDEWKNARAILSTTFTSGKLKGVGSNKKASKIMNHKFFCQMSNLMLDCSNNLNEHIQKIIEKDRGIFEGRK